MRLRIDLAYDGGPFRGFAVQRGRDDLATVQGTLEGALSRCWQDDVASFCAGRTDAGVHALAQVVHVDADPDNRRVQRAVADLERFRLALDKLTGDAISIWRVEVVDAGFHARFSATERRYRYRLTDQAAVDPLERHRVWQLPRTSLSVPRMRAGARHLLGEHDFDSFCRQAAGGHNRRTLRALTIARRDGVIHARLRGPAFCHQMVRSIIGCLVAVGDGRREPDWIGEVLAARDRTAAVAIAPPHGLVLEGVSFGRRYPAAPRPEIRRALGL
ncbi:MAG TPA: tRNA pseudouridine(38-40) synthase TruA [Nitriliruptorales bacterium]